MHLIPTTRKITDLRSRGPREHHRAPGSTTGDGPKREDGPRTAPLRRAGGPRGGLGAQYGDADFILDPLDTSRWDPVLRFGLGIDGYITENWLVNVEIAPGIRFKDWNDLGGQATDNVTLTLSAGVEYRF
jgi:hypothetical protein